MKTLKQLNKNFYSALLTLAVLLLSISSSSAAENIGYYARPYPNINKYLSNAFNENEYGVKIIDSDKGEDVTDSFISKNKELYENGDWDAIMENFNQNHYYLSVETNPDGE